MGRDTTADKHEGAAADTSDVQKQDKVQADSGRHTSTAETSANTAERLGR
jgi:hypothetical protein